MDEHKLVADERMEDPQWTSDRDVRNLFGALESKLKSERERAGKGEEARELALAITNLQNAEDKFGRSIQARP